MRRLLSLMFLVFVFVVVSPVFGVTVYEGHYPAGSVATATTMGLERAAAISGQRTIDFYRLNSHGDYEVTQHYTNGDSRKNQFGSNIAMDNDLLVVGAYGGLDSGVYVFDGESAATWWLLSFISMPPSNVFGWSVDISGNTIVAGDPGYPTKGAAYAWERRANGWELYYLVPPVTDDTLSQFGCDVAIDGDWAVVGANMSIYGQGEAQVFKRVTTGWGGWEYYSTLLPTGTPNSAKFGTSVAIDGDTIVIGAAADQNKGAAYVFNLDDGSWTQTTKLIGSDITTYAAFGWDVAIDGDDIVVGAIAADDSRGAAYWYTNYGNGWEEVGKLIPDSNRESVHFGHVSIYDGVAAVGCDQGGTYFFAVPEPSTFILALISLAVMMGIIRRCHK